MFSFFNPAGTACRTADSTSAVAAPATAPAETTATAILPAVTPAIDVVETAKGLVLYADLPGVAQSGLELDIDGDRLTLRGTPATTGPSQDPVHQDVGQRRFERSFILSDRIDRERIEAHLNDGVLRLDLPHRASTTPRRIAIRT